MILQDFTAKSVILFAKMIETVGERELRNLQNFST